MRTTGKNLTATIRRRATQLLAALFVLYAFADISVLQAYCGNETIGIPSQSRQLQIEKQRNSKSENIENSGVSQAADSDRSSGEEQTPDPHSSEESCFGCCSHILLGTNLAASMEREIVPLKITTSNFSVHRQMLSDSYLTRLYQPPKLA